VNSLWQKYNDDDDDDNDDDDDDDDNNNTKNIVTFLNEMNNYSCIAYLFNKYWLK